MTTDAALSQWLETWKVCRFCEELVAGHSPEELASCAADIAAVEGS